jgi:hypothetical protein
MASLDLGVFIPDDHHDCDPIYQPLPVMATCLIRYLRTLAFHNMHVLDALTGRKLHVLTQCVAIGVTLRAPEATREAEVVGEIVGEVIGDASSFSEIVGDAGSLSLWMRRAHDACCAGGPVRDPPSALLLGGAATGKSTVMAQVLAHIVQVRKPFVCH